MTATQKTTRTTSRTAEALAAAGFDSLPVDFPSRLDRVTAADVQRELSFPIAPFSVERLLTLLSPAAAELIEKMARVAQSITRQRFGKAINLYAPLYVSNFCVNACAYCGFSIDNTQGDRMRLTVDQAVEEARLLHEQGVCDILLVAGEDPRRINVEYLSELAGRLRETFSAVAIEVHTLSAEDYRRLFAAGIDGVTIYQETYDRAVYGRVHTWGPKADFDLRLANQEAAAGAGMRRLNIGALLGLSDWRFETVCLALHARTLLKHFWQAKVAFSFPRIRAAEKVELENFQSVSDQNLAQMMLALRIMFPDAGLVLSTRELPAFRDQMFPLCITQMSAGSKTNPGGYSDSQRQTRGYEAAYQNSKKSVPLPQLHRNPEKDNRGASEQFSISDERSLAEIADLLRTQGFDPVWKDWDTGFQA